MGFFVLSPSPYSPKGGRIGEKGRREWD